LISPWNFPLAILCGMACAAVVGGNTVLLKPSNNTPVIAAELVRLCVEAGFPPGVFNLVTGRGLEVGERVIAPPRGILRPAPAHGATDAIPRFHSTIRSPSASFSRQ